MNIREESLSIRLPEGGFRETFEEFAGKISNPVARLKFLRKCVDAYQAAPASLSRFPFRRWSSRIVALECFRDVAGASLAMPDQILLVAYKAWSRAESALLALQPKRAFALAGAAAAVAAVSFAPALRTSADTESTAPKPAAAVETIATPPNRPARAEHGAGLEIWLVETDGLGELYSNGLRVDNQYLTHHEPRLYPVVSAGPGLDETAQLDDPVWRSDPAGIVYHTTVSDLPPLEPENNQLIRYRGDQLLGYLAKRKLYNFVIDRFGRAFRLVPEDEYALHAGYSMWADGAERYFNLNESFIGVAFESRPDALDPEAGPEAAITEAQVRTASLLTEMLRDRYGIPVASCVTHEMISLSPQTMLIGYHTDWAGRFPFEQLGLPDNYRIGPPAVAEWGFGYDAELTAVLGETAWPGLDEAEKQFERQARALGVSSAELRSRKKSSYRLLLKKLREVKEVAGIGASS